MENSVVRIEASAKDGEGAGRGPCGLRNSELGPLPQDVCSLKKRNFFTKIFLFMMFSFTTENALLTHLYKEKSGVLVIFRVYVSPIGGKHGFNGFLFAHFYRKMPKIRSFLSRLWEQKAKHTWSNTCSTFLRSNPVRPTRQSSR